MKPLDHYNVTFTSAKSAIVIGQTRRVVSKLVRLYYKTPCTVPMAKAY